MKKTLSCIFAVMLALSSFATPQEANIIFIDGKAWSLFTTEPISEDSALYSKMMASLPKDRTILTLNWNGYISFWSIKKDCLLLDSIQMKFYDKEKKQLRTECLDKSKMRKLFKGYTKNKGAMAKWFTGSLRMARGERIREEYLGAVYEYEILLTVEKGRVTKRNDYQNKVFDGYSFDHNDLSKNQDKDELRALLIPHLEKYPELLHAKQIKFSIKNVTMDASGHITNCSVTAKVDYGDNSEKEHQGIAEDMKQNIMAVHPWKIVYWNGQYVAYALENFMIPCKIDD